MLVQAALQASRLEAKGAYSLSTLQGSHRYLGLGLRSLFLGSSETPNFYAKLERYIPSRVTGPFYGQGALVGEAKLTPRGHDENLGLGGFRRLYQTLRLSRIEAIEPLMEARADTVNNKP